MHFLAIKTVATYAVFFGSYLVFALRKFPGMKIARPGAAVIVVEQSRAVVEIRFSDYFRVGLPITLLTLGLGSLWLWWIH